jgi:predicted Na+-dependent transporter
MLNTVQFGNTGTVVPGAIVEVLHKMALLKAAVHRRYNKWQQSDSKQPASPSVCCLCAGRYVSLAGC